MSGEYIEVVRSDLFEKTVIENKFGIIINSQHHCLTKIVLNTNMICKFSFLFTKQSIRFEQYFELISVQSNILCTRFSVFYFIYTCM